MKRHLWMILIGTLCIFNILISTGVASNSEKRVSDYLEGQKAKAHIIADTNDIIYSKPYTVDSFGLIQHGEDVATGNLYTRWGQSVNRKIYTLKAQWRAEAIKLQQVTRSWKKWLVSKVWADWDIQFRSSRSEARISHEIERGKTYYFAFDVAVLENWWSNESWQVIQQLVEHSLGKAPIINLTLKSEIVGPSFFDANGNETVNKRNYFDIENNSYRFGKKKLVSKLSADPGWHKFEYVFTYGETERDTFIIWHNNEIIYDSADTTMYSSVLSQCSLKENARTEDKCPESYDGKLSVKTWIYRWYNPNNGPTQLWYKNIYLSELKPENFPE